MAGLIRIKNWRRHQHYRHRNPPWIKLHVSLLDPAETPWYRGLSDTAARFLMELWLLASKGAGTVPYDSLMILRETGRTTADKPLLDSALRELASAGAITVAGEDASAVFLATLAHRGTEVQRDRDTETEGSVASLRSATGADAPREGNPKTTDDGPGTTGREGLPEGRAGPKREPTPAPGHSQAHSGPTAVPRETRPRVEPGTSTPEQVTDTELMGLVREWLYVPDGREPVGWSAGRDVTILRAMRQEGYDGASIRDAILGLAIQRETGELDWLRPGEKATLRALYHTETGLLPTFTAALTACYDAQKQRPRARTETSPQHIGAIVRRLQEGT